LAGDLIRFIDNPVAAYYFGTTL